MCLIVVVYDWVYRVNYLFIGVNYINGFIVLKGVWIYILV